MTAIFYIAMSLIGLCGAILVWFALACIFSALAEILLVERFRLSGVRPAAIATTCVFLGSISAAFAVILLVAVGAYILK